LASAPKKALASRRSRCATSGSSSTIRMRMAA
jgi:hypothetical protein